MKTNNIFIIIFSLAIAAALLVSGLAVYNVYKKAVDDGVSNGTSGDDITDPPSESTPGGSGNSGGTSSTPSGGTTTTPDTSTDSIVYGNTVTIGTKPSNWSDYDPQVYYNVEGQAFASTVDNVTYFGVKFDIPYDSGSIAHAYFKDVELSGLSCVYRYSLDGKTWKVLKNELVDDVKLHAHITKGSSRTLYISVFAVTDLAKDEAAALAEYEKLFTTDIGFGVSSKCLVG